jgi:hypothetical protein
MGFIFNDFWNCDFFSLPEIRGIQRKRYNEEISGPLSCPVLIFHVVEKNPG